MTACKQLPVSPTPSRAKKTLAILMPAPWSVRNIVTSGLLDELIANGVPVKLLCPDTLDWQATLPGREGLEILPLLTASPERRFPGYHFLNSVRNAAFSYRHGTYAQKKSLANNCHPPGLAGKLREKIIQASGWALAQTNTETALDRLHGQAYQKQYNLDCIKQQLRQHSIEFLLSTICVDQAEYPYAIAARALGIPTASAILSFDNLSTRGRLPVFDYYLVWNERMSQQVHQMYHPQSENGVYITGTPQFDFHVNNSFKWSKDETLNQLQLPAGAQYLLYAANHQVWTPTEPELVRQLAERLKQSTSLRNLWIVVRLHPLDDASRWEQLAAPENKLVISHPKVSNSNGTPTNTVEQKLLVSSLQHCAACINVGSTISLDAAILGKPVICIAFASQPDSREDRVYKAIYQTQHYRPLVESRGIELAANWEQLLQQIHNAITEPHQGQAQRKQMVEQECGRVDGQAAKRMAATLLNWL